jgi:hypothetical protein
MTSPAWPPVGASKSDRDAPGVLSVGDPLGLALARKRFGRDYVESISKHEVWRPSQAVGMLSCAYDDVNVR